MSLSFIRLKFLRACLQATEISVVRQRTYFGKISVDLIREIRVHPQLKNLNFILPDRLTRKFFRHQFERAIVAIRDVKMSVVEFFADMRNIEFAQFFT